MGVQDITGDAVGQAIEECKRLGVDAFLATHGFRDSRAVVLEHEGEQLPLKAILAVAHGYAVPEEGPLRPAQLRGGDEVEARLRALGFTTRRRDGATADRRARVWVVRAGRHGESLELALEEGWCGIGWPELGDLAGLDDESLDREIDAAYAGERPAAVGQYKRIVRDFMQIRVGDLVITPIKDQGKVAVGRVVGDYEHRPHNPETAHHVRRVEWLTTDLPRDLLGDMRRWVDRPAAVSRVPVEGGERLLLQAIDDEEAIILDEAATPGALQALIERTLDAVAAEDVGEVRRLVDKEGPGVVAGVIGDDWPIATGTGVATPAQVPWISVHPRGAEASAQEGFYAVYLFAADGSSCYLSLNQGTERLRGGAKPLLKRALDIRAAAGMKGAADPIDLASTGGRPQKYEAGNAHAIQYARGAVPGEAELRGDLERMLEVLESVQEAGLKLDPEIEPLHLVLKWSSDLEPQTIERHEAMLAEHGATWWPKVGRGGIDSRKLDQIYEQIDRGIATHAFLYGGGQVVRASVRAIAKDPYDIDDALMPDYVDEHSCGLFVLIDGLEPLSASWALDHLVLASDPDPSRMPGALSNTATLLYVHERFVPPTSKASRGPTKRSLTLDWLERETLWSADALDEVLEALEPESGKGQVILAGPPGTGKTWVAERLARYLTQDKPLHRRLVQFHPSYGYEEFVEGIRPVAVDGAITFERQPGVVLKMAEQMSGASSPHVLVVDELNRANIPRVFGELLYLLEYREEAIDLQYSEQFVLPRNLRVIATMNTADRSIRAIDIALRRRFEVFECRADPEVLARFYERDGHASSVDGLVEGFISLNAHLSELLDRHHAIGQSFFMHPAFSREMLKRTWRRQIMPLIEDYFFDQPDVAAEFELERYWPGL